MCNEIFSFSCQRIPFFALASCYKSELFESLTHPFIILKMIFVLKPSNLFIIDSKPLPLLKGEKQFRMHPLLPVHTYFSSSFLILVVFSPIVSLSRKYSSLSACLLLLSFHCFWNLLPLISFFFFHLFCLFPPESFLSCMFFSIHLKFFSVVSPSLFSYLYPQISWVISILTLPDHLP